VAGIVAENGGMLSHLAIMAREFGVPVLVGVGREEVKFGERVEITSEKLKVKS